MKFIENFFDGLKPNFEEGGKWHKYWPIYDGFYTIFMVPGHTTHHGSHIRDGIDLKKTMDMVVKALIPCLLFGIWNAGHQYYLAEGQFTEMWYDGFFDKLLVGAMAVLPIVLVSYIAGLVTEFAFCVIKGHQINEGFLVTGMLIPLTLPVDVPLWMVAVATIFAVVFGKEVFGGTGMNILNPALTARAFLFFAYPTDMSGDKPWIYKLTDRIEDKKNFPTIDATSGETQLGMWYKSISEGVIPDKAYSTMDLFWGVVPGSIGETSVFVILLGAGLLIATGIGSWKIMLSGLIGGLTMAGIFNVAGANPYMDVNPLAQIFAGGFMFGLVFMATDPVSAAQTEVGKIIYGFFVGVFAIMIRVFNPAYPEGVMLAILFMNVMAPVIDHYVVQGNIKERLGRLKPHA